MSVLLSLIIFIIYVFITRNILTGGYNNIRTFIISDSNKEFYEMSPLMLYLIFTIVTAPLFLVPPFAIAKYAVYFIVLIYLFVTSKINAPDNWIIRSYWIFYIWLLFSAFRGANYMDSLAFIIKYTIPVLSLYLGYSALQSKYDIYLLVKNVLISVVVYTFLIGGLSAKYYSWFYFSPLGEQFLKYAGFADYLTSLFILPFVMVCLTRNKKWYWVAVAMLLSSVLEVVRTGLGGMFIVISVFTYYKYKYKSLPIIIGIAALLLAVILFVPEVNQKFFGNKAGTITAEAIVQDNAMSLDNIQTNGREFMWTVVMNKCYYGHELIGSGLGSSIQYLKYVRENIIKVPLLLHNDYVQIICDTGLIGLSLLILFFIVLLCSISRRIWNTDVYYVRITGTMAIASSCGIAFSMGFDNVVSHSMTSLVMPFIFIGIYLKTIRLSENDELS